MAKGIFKYKIADLFNPTIHALHELGGSGSIGEIEEQVTEILKLTEDEANDLHKGNITKLSYKLAWARNYLKWYGLLENSARGVWTLTERGLATKEVDKEDVRRVARQKRKESTELVGLGDTTPNFEIEEEEIQELTWKEALVEIIKKIDPIAFERLCQRLLRELGFQNVEVTKRSNDGGIDGIGIIKIGSIVSFRCVFQAKRYQDTVPSEKIRDFRGAMSGRADRGVVITTGTFSREAKKEAIRDGALPIDLIDGYELAERLKDLRLGVEVEMVEKVNIKTDWFKSI